MINAKHRFALTTLTLVLFSAPVAWSMSQSAVPQASKESSRQSLVLMEKVQQSIKERETSLHATEILLQENSRLLQQNLAILYKIRNLKSEDSYEGQSLSEAIRSNLEAQRENQKEIAETDQAVAEQKRLYAKNERIVADLQSGNFVLESQNGGADSGAMLENLKQSNRKNHSIVERNRERVEENKASLHQNQQILSALAD